LAEEEGRPWREEGEREGRGEDLARMPPPKGLEAEGFIRAESLELDRESRREPRVQQR
jgi:hypothetical protein